MYKLIVILAVAFVLIVIANGGFKDTTPEPKPHPQQHQRHDTQQTQWV